MKLIKEMELIGQPPAESKRHEIIRRNVNNPHLSHIVVELNLPESRKISLDGFFEDCNHYIQYNKEKDSGRKRKAEEVLGRTVKVVDDPSSVVGDQAISDSTTIARWLVPLLCSLCKAHIGGDNHNARSCCKDSARVFPKGARSDRLLGRKLAAKTARLLPIVANLLLLLLLLLLFLLLPLSLIILPLLLQSLLFTILMGRL